MADPKVKVVHVFYDVFMGWSHASLLDVMRESSDKATLERGEIAIFINKAWTGVKMLTTGNHLIYKRLSHPLSLEDIRFMPAFFGGPKLTFTKDLEANMVQIFNARMGKQLRSMKVLSAKEA